MQGIIIYDVSSTLSEETQKPLTALFYLTCRLSLSLIESRTMTLSKVLTRFPVFPQLRYSIKIVKSNATYPGYLGKILCPSYVSDCSGRIEDFHSYN